MLFRVLGVSKDMMSENKVKSSFERDGFEYSESKILLGKHIRLRHQEENPCNYCSRLKKSFRKNAQQEGKVRHIFLLAVVFRKIFSIFSFILFRSEHCWLLT